MLNELLVGVGIGVILAVSGQALLTWRQAGVDRTRFESIQAKLDHQDKCTDKLRIETAESLRRLWAAVDVMGKELSNLSGQWAGVVLERTGQTARPKGGGQT